MDSNIQAAPCLEFDFENNNYLKILQNKANESQHASTEFFSFVAKEHAFPGYTFPVSWEFHPGLDQRKKRFSFVVKSLYNVDWKATDPYPKPQQVGFILHAWGIGKGAEDCEIQKVEQHAFEYLRKHYAAREERSAWVMFYFDSQYRILVYEVGKQRLLPFYPFTERRSKLHYLDLTRGTEALYKRICEYMKRHLEPDTALFNKHMLWIEGTVQGDCPID